MLSVYLIGVLALAAAICVAVVVVRRRQRETGTVSTWSDVKQAFHATSIADVRQESAMLADPRAHESDVGVADLLTDLAEDGSGYLEPRDLLASRHQRA